MINYDLIRCQFYLLGKTPDKLGELEVRNKKGAKKEEIQSSGSNCKYPIIYSDHKRIIEDCYESIWCN